MPDKNSSSILSAAEVSFLNIRRELSILELTFLKGFGLTNAQEVLLNFISQQPQLRWL